MHSCSIGFVCVAVCVVGTQLVVVCLLCIDYVHISFDMCVVGCCIVTSIRTGFICIEKLCIAPFCQVPFSFHMFSCDLLTECC